MIIVGDCSQFWHFPAIGWSFFPDFRPNSVQNCEFRFSVQMPNFAISPIFHPKRFCSVPNYMWSLMVTTEDQRRFDAIPSRLTTPSSSLVAVCTARRRWYWWDTLPVVTVLDQLSSKVPAGSDGPCMSSVPHVVLPLSTSNLGSSGSLRETEVLAVRLSACFLRCSREKYFLNRHIQEQVRMNRNLSDASHSLTRWQHCSAWNDVMPTIWKVWGQIKNCQLIFTWGTIAPNFIPIWFETTKS